MQDNARLSHGQVLGRWILFVLAFIFFGGIGAGVTALLHERAPMPRRS